MPNKSLLLLLLTMCTAGSSPGHPQAIFHTEREDVTVALEVAADDAQRAKGLMYRESMPAFSGMIFVFPAQESHTFWMKNTYIPLDMIFVDDTLHVVGTLAKAEPMTQTPRRIDKASRYVIEVNGGFAESHGIVAGTQVKLVNVPAPTLR